MERLLRGRFSFGSLLACLIAVLLYGGQLFAQAAEPVPAGEAPPVELSNRQQQIFRDYERFEKALFDIAEQTRRKDPERAELLFRARGQSQEQRILGEMQAISELLKGQPKYGDALSRQNDLLPRMQAVLKLLQSLDDRDRVSDEIARVEDLLKDTNRLLANEKDVHADTQRGGDADRLSSQQKKVAEQAQELAEKIARQDKAREDAEGQRENKDGPDPAENPSPEMTPGDNGKPGEDPLPGAPMPGAEPKESMPSDDPMEAGESKPSKSMPEGKPMPGDAPMPSGESSPSESPSGEKTPQPGAPPMPGAAPMPPPQGEQSPGESDPGEQQPQDEQATRGREQLEQARREMQQALEELKGKNLKGAEQEQDAAIANLEVMKAELEKILRQLREEEKEMYLTLLEARFQNMLRKQEQINAETVRLDDIVAAERPATFGAKIEVVKRQQDDNVLDAQKALSLLMEEGSSVAFPEAVEQMQKNMETVAGRLSKQDTGETTQVIEQLIVETLEEMIFAMQQEMEKLEEKKRQQQQGEPQPPEDPALVNQLAELKMIRSLQNQVNRLTKQIGMNVDGEQATEADQLELLDDLAARQQRIQSATYDLSVGKNQ